MLNAIAVQQGILVERAEDVFSFSHLTLQEYLTAQYIDDHRQVEKLVTEHLIDKRWKEVFLLVAGLMRGGADDLLLLMEKEAQKYINTPKLQALLNWAEQVTAESPGNFKHVGKRAVAIANANVITMTMGKIIGKTISNAYSIADANAIGYANANFYVMTNAMAYAINYTNAKANADAIAYAIQYINELEDLKIFKNINLIVLIDQLEKLKAKIPDDKQLKQVHQAFGQYLQQTLLNGFNLTSEMVSLSEEEAEALGDYLYANHLIIQCKQVAVRVSPQTWEAIEARMLLVSND
ncbi:MAG: hypothetical protein RM338_18425 [Nostoc sp. DedQUE12a]|nr:hypothetical protein [Nostoc sp. DedQUE12a]